jgi:hypothetical protein
LVKNRSDPMMHGELLRKISGEYEKSYALKLQRIAEEERKKLEAEQARIRAEREEMIKAKAKQMGYLLEKKVEKDNRIRLVLVRRTY